MKNRIRRNILNVPRGLILMLFAMSFLCIPAISFAGYVGPNIGISTVQYDQQNPDVIYITDPNDPDNKGLWFVVWEDWRNKKRGADIYGQFIYGYDNSGAGIHAGNKCGSEFLISNDLGAGNQTVPKAAYRYIDSVPGKIVVVWQDTRGTSSGGYVRYRTITPTDFATCAKTLGTETAIGFNGTNEWDRSQVITPTPSTTLIGIGDGSTTNFVSFLNAPVESSKHCSLSKTTFCTRNADCPVSETCEAAITITDPGPPSQTLTDNGAGSLIGSGGSGTIDYNTGVISIKFATAPGNGSLINATYVYDDTSFAFTEIPVNDGLFSRRAPKISYDPVRDGFWITYVESRTTLNRISEVCFGLQVADWDFGDNTFPGFVMLDGNTLAEVTDDLGIPGADIIRNGSVRTNRLITESHGALTETYEFEYFATLNNITVASDSTSPETFLAWEGIRKKGLLTCSCKDNDNNGFCDLPADVITDSFATSNYDDGKVHIYSLFDKEIPQGVIYSMQLDASTSSAYYPSIGFDPISGRFLAAWEDLRDGSNTKVYGRLIYSGGGLYNNDFIISFEDTNNDGQQDSNVANSKQTKPYVSYDSVNQRFFVAWQDGRNSTLSLENLDIYGQKIDAEGSQRGDNFPIFTLKKNQYNPAIAYDDFNNQFLSVWKDARNLGKYTCGGKPCGSDIFGQRFTLDQPSLTLLNTDNTPLTPPNLTNYENPIGSGSVEAGLSDTKSFKIRNTGDETLKIDYIDETCGGTLTDIAPFSFDGLPSQLTARNDLSTVDLVPAAELTLTVRFAPTVGGSYNKCFIIESDGGTPQVNLSALSVESNISVSPTSYAFGYVYIGSHSDKIFTMSNVGTASLKISTVDSPSSPFSILTDGCSGQNVAPGFTCNITVRFTPTTTSALPTSFSSQFVINSNDPDTPALTVTFTGGGLGAMDITVNPLSVAFGNVQVGQTSSSQTITVKNDGNAPLTNLVIGTLDPPFSRTHNCPSTLNVGSSCQVSATFSPAGTGSLSANLSITSDDPDEGTVTVSLTGTGVVTPNINVSSTDTLVVSTDVSPVFENFDNTAVGSSSPLDVTVKNTGTANLAITGLTNPAGDFSIIGSTCLGKTFLPNEQCTISLSFKPTSTGIKTSSFTISSNDPDTPVFTVNLTGTGGSGGNTNAQNISVNPTSVSFSNTPVGTKSSTTKTVIISNTGGTNLIISSIVKPGSPFNVTSYTCNLYSSTTLTPTGSTASCDITFVFNPTLKGSYTRYLTINSNDPDQPQVKVTFTGAGI